ncbi:MAG: Ribosome-binding factor A [Tenericutes bacterium ADurb.Bin239]|jgi:ribosome-binding factor A|nr:MAG: Ribosome-binding factor A [Tenericutes bacterium ADurb.Bin239]
MAKHSLSRNESLMLRHLSEIISYKVGDPSLGLATVSAVELTRDYSYAKVYITFLGDGDINAKMEILNNASGYIRHELSKRMNIRKTPELRFIYDDTFEKAAKIDEILKRTKK